MALIRTILALIILVILLHVGIVYANVDVNTNGFTQVVDSLGLLLESPAQALLTVLPLSAEQRNIANPGEFYPVAITAVIGYFILYLLLGVGRRR